MYAQTEQATLEVKAGAYAKVVYLHLMNIKVNNIILILVNDLNAKVGSLLWF